MHSHSSHDLKSELKDLLSRLGAFKVGIADPYEGFEKAVDGCHPLDHMKDCRAVVVFAFNIGLDYYRSLDYQHNDIRLGHLYRDSAVLQLINFLRMKGYDAREAPRGFKDESRKIAHMSFKLAAYEAGIGVYGKPATIITPEYGPRVNLGVILTDARLEPDGRMAGFKPCANCIVCAEVCPVKAVGDDLPAPLGFRRDLCVRFIDWIRKKTNEKAMLCGHCFDECPTGKLVRETLRIKRWKTLRSIKADVRKRLINTYNKQTKQGFIE